jgi:hypothetical protein
MGLVGGKHYIISPCLFAHSIVTLAAPSVLSTFDLLKKVDENGREIEPKMEYTQFGIR